MEHERFCANIRMLLRVCFYVLEGVSYGSMEWDERWRMSTQHPPHRCRLADASFHKSTVDDKSARDLQRWTSSVEKRWLRRMVVLENGTDSHDGQIGVLKGWCQVQSVSIPTRVIAHL